MTARSDFLKYRKQASDILMRMLANLDNAHEAVTNSDATTLNYGHAGNLSHLVAKLEEIERFSEFNAEK